MTVGELLEGQIVRTSLWAREVTGLQYDSRKLRQRELFFAFPGARVDGHEFVAEALKTGAAAIVSERPAPQGLEDRWVQVKHGREALAAASLRFYRRPDRRLKLTGVTGTNGKTTTAWLIDKILTQAGLTTALIGTVDHKIGDKRFTAVNTTPESLDIVRYLTQLESQNGTHATLEVSSHALELRRVHGMDFHTVVLTNFSQDHLDFHGTMKAYGQAKRRLFEGAGGAVPKFAVVNADDPFGKKLLEMPGLEPLSYGSKRNCSIRATKIRAGFEGLHFIAKTPAGDCEISSALRGRFNVLNILAAIATGLTYELALDTIARAIATHESVAGRFEVVDQGQPFLVVVDYAHTDDALKNLIQSARDLLQKEKQPGRVLTLFGCGGDRDRTKRPAMGEIAGQLSDLVILTSDNPRSEDPLNIINDILVGLRRVETPYELKPDRAEAIGWALSQARVGDIVLIAGKGHERYQTVGQEKIPFDDVQVAREVLRELGYAKPANRRGSARVR